MLEQIAGYIEYIATRCRLYLLMSEYEIYKGEGHISYGSS